MRKIERTFLIFFFALIVLPFPLFHALCGVIPTENTENKAEAVFPELNAGNFSTWPKRFESWLSDTLPFKTQFIRLYRGLQYRCGTDYLGSDVLRGEGDWLFYRKTLDNYKGLSVYSDEELRQMRDNLSNFFAGLREKGIEPLFYIAPDKEQVYDEFMPAAIRRGDAPSQGESVSAYLRANTDERVLYPREELRALKAEMPLYFNSDTHWNELGGWVAAQQIRETFTAAPADYQTAWHYYHEDGKDLANMIGLSFTFPEHNSVLIDFEDGINAGRTESVDWGTLQRYRSDAPSGKKLFVLGDSFAEYYLRSAIHDVSEITFVSFGNLSRVDLTAESPEYFVLMLVERNIPFLMQGFY